MSVKCQVIIDALEKLAPKYLAEEWDNVGLLLGSPAQDITNILVTLDVTPQVVEYAVQHNVNLIVSHHPVIFKSIKHLRTDLPTGSLLAKILKNDIAVYAAHTNLDIANGGVNDILAAKLGLSQVEPLEITFFEKLVKLVVFVPKEYEASVRKAMTSAGAGHIGNYSDCAFQTEGIGTFKPLANTRPFIGTEGVVEFVPECRIETILPEKMMKRVVNAMIKAHPYEEVAYDLYPIENRGMQYGLGRIGKLATAVSFEDFIQMLKEKLHLSFVNVAKADDTMLIQKVALCGGNGTSLIQKAVFKGADVLVTGDVKYHDAQEALAHNLAIIDAGHFMTEQPVVAGLLDYLTQCSKKSKWSVAIIQDNISQDVFTVC